MRNLILYFLFLLFGTWGIGLPTSVRASELLPDYTLFHRVGLGAQAAVVTCLVQDTEGLLWAGSDRGLFCYDGYTAQQCFEYGTRQNTRIYCGVVADSTHLYLGADNGLLVYNYRKDEYVETKADFPKDIRTLAHFGGRWWLGTLHGLYAYDPASGQLADVSEGLPHQAVYALLAASDGCLYVGTYDGCCRLRTDGGTAYEPVPLPMWEGKSNRFVNALLEDPERGCLWIGMEGGLLRYDHRTGGKAVVVEGYGGNSVKSLALDDDGHLLAGTDNGLYVHDDGNDRPKHIVHDSRNPQSLSSDIVWTILKDSDGNIWLGTDYGISLSRRRTALLQVPIASITGTGEGNRFYAMLRDRKGYYWFGGTNGLIRFQYPGNQNTEETRQSEWYKMGDVRHPLSHNRVRQLYEDRDGILWVATDGGVNRYDAKTHRFVAYNIVDSTRRYNANWVYGIFEDSDSQLWIATCLGGIFVVDKRALLNENSGVHVARRMFTTDNGLPGLFVNQMVQDRDGNVWALFYNNVNSLEKIDPHTGRVTHVAADVLNGEQVPTFLLCSTDGHIWVGNQGGVMRITPANGHIHSLTFGTGNHQEVLCMAEAEDRIWISTSDGFWVTDREGTSLRRLNVAEQRFTSLYYDPTDRLLYLGMVDGFAVASPARLLEGQPHRPLRLTALHVNNLPYHPASDEADNGIRYARRLRLEHHQRNLAFELSDLPYSSEEKSRIVYRWDGTENGWTLLQPGTNRITFNNLAYGHHRLVANRLDDYGRPDGTPYTLDIEIRPPWYYAPWAMSVYGLLALALAAWTVNFFRVKSHLKLVRLEKKQILEQSQAKMEFYTNLSHDLKTPLSMIIAPVSRLLPQVRNKLERQVLEQVQRNAMKLNSLIHSGLDIHRVDSGSNLLLIQSQVELVQFARNLFDLYADDTSRGKALHFEFRSERPALYLQMDAVKLESILDNLLSNAVKYTPDGGEVTFSIALSENGKEVRISVADTGVGIPLQEQPYVFQRFFQSSRTAGESTGTGIGLYLVKTYTELHGGNVMLQSTDGGGTTVTVTLPGVEMPAPTVSADLQPSDPTPDEPHPADDEPPLPPDAPVVLAVEDDPDTADFIRQVLHTRYRCLRAANGQDALDMVRQEIPALIITDMMMPVMDGLEMVRQLKKYVPASTVPIILLTGKADKQTELESIRLHIDAFIAKPFEADILLSRVEQLLSSHQTYEAKARLEIITQPKDVEVTSPDEQFLANVTQLIEEHIADAELNVNALCEWTGISSKQMYRKLKQLTGQTPVEYIKSIRMKKAAILLKQHKFTVAEVMYMVGFSNHSYFSKCFQAAFGVTPKQY